MAATSALPGVPHEDTTLARHIGTGLPGNTVQPHQVGTLGSHYNRKGQREPKCSIFYYYYYIKGWLKWCSFFLYFDRVVLQWNYFGRL